MNTSRRNFIALSTICLTAPLTTLLASEAEPLQLDEHIGKVVMVDFWASWCLPCKRSFPWLNEIYAKHKDNGLVVIGVNVDENKDDAKAFLADVPANFEIIYDKDGQYAKQYQIKAMPSSLIFDRQGKLVAQHHGFLTSKISSYESLLESVL